MMRLALLLPFLGGALLPGASVFTPLATPASPAAIAPAADGLGGRPFAWASQCINSLKCCSDPLDPCCVPTPPTCGDPFVSSCSFVNQKADGVCVYQCIYQQDCTDCLGNQFSQDPGGHRYRLGPYGTGQCPPADCSLCP
jgi:hypothetical protein